MRYATPNFEAPSGPAEMSQGAKQIFKQHFDDLQKCGTLPELKDGIEWLHSFAKKMGDAQAASLVDGIYGYYLNAAKGAGSKSQPAQDRILANVKAYVAQSNNNPFWTNVAAPGTTAAPKSKGSLSLPIESEYADRIRKIKETFSVLDNYSNMDDLAGLKSIYNVLNSQIDDVSLFVSKYGLSDMNRDLLGMLSASPYYKDCLKDGKFDRGELNKKITALTDAVTAMNAIDARINIFTQSGNAALPDVLRDQAAGAKIADFQRIGVNMDAGNLAKVNAIIDGGMAIITIDSVAYTMTRAANVIHITRDTTLSADEKANLRKMIGDLQLNSAAFDYVCMMRYGAGGEGFDAAYAALGITPAAGATPGDKYAQLSKEMLDSYRKLGDYASTTALKFTQAYATLVSSKVYVTTPDSLVGTRDAFDPFSRIAMFKAVQEGGVHDIISDTLLAQMVLRASAMPVSTPGLLLGSQSFFYTLALMPDDSLRQAVFNQAALLISNMYSNATNLGGVHQNYSLASKLMKKFEGLSASGTLASDFEGRTFYGLPYGHIGIKTPWQDIRFDRTYSMSTLESFARATFQPGSLFGWSVTTPQVTVGSQFTPTNAKFIFDQEHGEKKRYLGAMPSERSLTADYSPNSLELQASYGMIIGKMGDAYNEILKERISRLKVSSGSLALQGSGTSRGGSSSSYDAQGRLQGYESGQNMYMEAFQNWSTTTGSKYAPGQFSKFDEGKTSQTFVQMQANQMNVLGTNLWQGYVNYTNNKQKTLTDDSGNPVTVGGMTDEQMQRNLNINLNSTFPFSKSGTMLVNISEARNAQRPVATGTGAGKETDERYDVDIYVKKGNTWDHTILKDRSREFLQNLSGGDQTVGDAVNKYFSQLYSELGKRTTVDAAVEVGTQNYGWDKDKTGIGKDDRLGVMLILQPGMNAAGLAGATTQGDSVVGAGIQSKATVAFAGFYSFSDLDIMAPTAGNSTAGSYNFGMNNYYNPSYELDEKQPKGGKDRAYVGDVTWFAINKFRASVFGGWKTKGGEVLAGEDIRLKNANLSSFMSFDSSGKLASGILSAGGRSERVFGMDNVNLRGHVYALQGLGALLLSASTVTEFKDKLGSIGIASASLSNDDATAIAGLHNEGDSYHLSLEGKKYVARIENGMLTLHADAPRELGAAVSYRVGKGTMTISCNLRPEQWGNASIDNITLRRLVDNSQSIVDFVGKIPAETLLDVKLREPVMRDLQDRVRQVISQAIILNPTNDLYKSFLNNVSVGYRDASTDWAITASTTDDYRTFLTGMLNFKDKVGLIGGWKAGGSANSYGIDWLAGAKVRPGRGNTAFSLYVSQTKDKRLLINADAANLKLGAAAVSVGGDYYRVHVLAGPEQMSWIVNLVSIGTPTGAIKSQEYGMRVALWAPIFLTAIYSHTQMPGMSQDLLQDALYATASQYGLFPDKIKMDSFQMDLNMKLGKNTFVTLTGQATKMGGKENPSDFYVGAKLTWKP